MANIPYDASATLSALMYELKGYDNMKGKTLKEIFGSDILSPRMESWIKANGLENVTIADTSWDQSYGSTYVDAGSGAEGPWMYAATFELENGDVYVAYTGTGDGNWPYNADAAYGTSGKPSDMQKMALAYFEETLKNRDMEGNLYVTGHSQGGNNAMYITLSDSEHSGKIAGCISIDGQGFSDELYDNMKKQCDDWDGQKRKIYGVYGDNDYVHGLGEKHPEVETGQYFFVETNVDDDDSVKAVADCHDIFSHIGADGKLHPGEEGPVSKLVAELMKNLDEDMTDEEKYQIAHTVMSLLENINPNRDTKSVPVDAEDIWALIHTGAVPVIIETLVENPELIGPVLDTLAVDDTIVNWIKDNPLSAAAAVVAVVLFHRPVLTVVKGAVTLVYLVDFIKDSAEKISNALGAAGKFLVNVCNAVSKYLQSIGEYFRSRSGGARHAADNPYVKVDTVKLEDYRDRLARVNDRLEQLDGDLDGLYWQVGLLDIWEILRANIWTGGSPALTRVQAYLKNTASRFEAAEQKAIGHLGG